MARASSTRSCGDCRSRDDVIACVPVQKDVRALGQGVVGRWTSGMRGRGCMGPAMRLPGEPAAQAHGWAGHHEGHRSGQALAMLGPACGPRTRWRLSADALLARVRLARLGCNCMRGWAAAGNGPRAWAREAGSNLCYSLCLCCRRPYLRMVHGSAVALPPHSIRPPRSILESRGPILESSTPSALPPPLSALHPRCPRAAAPARDSPTSPSPPRAMRSHIQRTLDPSGNNSEGSRLNPPMRRQQR
jgi:hypothetical protein